MQQCSIYDSSLRFSRAIYGALTLIAFLIRSQWLVLLVALMIILGAVSIRFNIFYQLHVLVSKKFFKKNIEPVQKELGEISFVAGMTGVLLLIGFFLVYFGKAVNFAWIFILVTTLLIFLACFVGFCVATLMYILLKKIFLKK